MSELTPSTAVPTADPLVVGRATLARHAWEVAFEQLSQADRDGQLSGADLEALAVAAFFGAHADGELGAKERAFKAYEAEGNELRAAYLALDIARSYATRASIPARPHTAEANRRGSDYSGTAVHVAARVAALAGGGEILAAAETLAEASDVSTSGARAASVKGVTAPVDIAEVAWA